MTFPTSVLIVGGSGGLGSALVKQYAKTIGGTNVFATTRSPAKPGQFPEGVNVIEGIDVSQKESAGKIVDGLKGRTVQVAIYVSGILKPEVRSTLCDAEAMPARTGTVEQLWWRRRGRRG
jgi:uncharacterized protein YbjT (DUF2867 family)